MKKGFTLIELLVVVLIIGILAAVAFPQYQKAVEKSRTAQALISLQSIYQAADAYYLTHGVWPSTVNELDVVAFTQNTEWEACFESDTNNILFGVGITRTQGKYAGTYFWKYKKHPYNWVPTEKILCIEPIGLFGEEPGKYCNKIMDGTTLPYQGARSVLFVLP